MEQNQNQPFLLSLESMNSEVQTTDQTSDFQLAELQEINSQLTQANEYLLYSCGFLLFIVIVILCEKIYKFFNIFF